MARRAERQVGPWVRCTTPMTIRLTGTDRVEHLWPGLIVNRERELAKGFTVGQAIAGRDECFEAVDGPGDVTDAEAPVTRQEE
jgi:hypothetical protein